MSDFDLGEFIPPVKYDNTRLLSFLKEKEDLRLEGYHATKDEAKDELVTVGWGSTRRVGLGDKITEEQAEEFFKQDVGDAEGHIRDLVKVPLNDNQRMALVSLVMNIGRQRLLDSKALKNLNNGDYKGFLFEANDPAMGFVKDRKGGEILGGLLKRRDDEGKMFNGTLWPEEERDWQKENLEAFDTTNDRFDELYLGN